MILEICDELNTEIADFIAIIDQKSKTVLIHCKHVKKKLSASAFQDVCEQAKKNLTFAVKNTINELDERFKDHIERWEQPWTVKGSKIKTSRKVKGKITGKEF